MKMNIAAVLILTASLPSAASAGDTMRPVRHRSPCRPRFIRWMRIISF